MKKSLNILFLIPTLIICSCDSLVEDLNNDPNNPTSVPYANVLIGAEVGNIVFQTGETARRAGIFCGYYTGIDRQHEGFNEYILTTSDFDALWDDAFVNTLRNAKVTQQLASEQGTEGIITGISQVLQAMTLGTLTALYGDVPFDEAAVFEIEDPQFEDQIQVYEKVQELLDQAIANLASGTGRPASGSDIYFDGDPASWTAVAYTLKARFYMHTKEYASAYDAAQSGIMSPGHSLQGPHGTATDNRNLNHQFFEVQSRKNDLVTSDFMVSFINPNSGTNPEPSRYRGNAKTDETGRYGFLFRTTSIGVQPNTQNGWAAEEAPSSIVTYEENLLILAEAGTRTEGFNTGLPRLNEFRSYMNDGGYLTNVDTSEILYEEYVATDFQPGGIENMDGISQENALLREILQERYITLFGQIEGFNDMRRTGNESIVRVPVSPNTGSQLPQRFIYPQSEINRNSNVPAPIPGLFDVTPVNQ